MSYLTQMAALTTQNFVSAATGIALLMALIRAFARDIRQDRRQLLGRPHPRDTLRAAAARVHRRAYPGLARGAAEHRAVCRCDHAGGRQADDQPGPGRLADRDQAARHQRRRLLERQLGGSLRESDPAQQFPPGALHSSDRGGAHPHLRPHGQGRAPRLGPLCRHVGHLPRRSRRLLLGRRRRQPALRRARARSRQHGRQGGSLRHRQFEPVGGGDHCRVQRLGQLHARQLHAAWRDDPACS